MRMRMKMESIKILIENILKESNDEYIQMLYEKHIKGKSITGGYKKDTLPEEKLLELLEKSTKDKRLQCLLIDILDEREINAASISDNVLRYCLNYPTPWKRTLLVSLAHMRLKKEQLEQLNSIVEASEAFYQLFILNLYDNNLHISQFRDFLLENEKYLGDVTNFREHIEGQNINQDKIDLTNHLARTYIEECIRTSTDLIFSPLPASLLLLNLYDDNFSVSQFREFLFKYKKYFINLADSTRLVCRELCLGKIDLVDQLICESAPEHEPLPTSEENQLKY